MFEPSSSNPPPPESPPPPPLPPRESGRALRLLTEVRAAQTRSLQTQGALLAICTVLVFLVGGAWVGAFMPRLGLALILGSLVVAGAVLGLFFVVLPRRRVGDDARTAKLLATQLPELNLDLLAAVELSKALGRAEDFSPDLARAFLRDVDLKASRLTVGKLIDPKPTQRAAMALLATVFVLLVVVVWKGSVIRAGLAATLTPADAAEPLRRQPITGDVEVTYRYPPHTGLDPRTVPSSTGDLSAPTGTEVTWKTRADRDVDEAALLLGKNRVPLKVKGRELEGTFVITENATFHVAFLDGNDLVAEGPDQSITAEVDQPPALRITAPLDGVELDAAHQKVTVAFEASDDFGLASLDLVYRAGENEPQRVKLTPDGRSMHGEHPWDVGTLGLKPGQVVTYYLEATDNDAVKGPKKGVSNSLTLKLYSSAEHRREALEKAEALWVRLVDYLGVRMENPDRASPTPLEAAVAGKSHDEVGQELARDLNELAVSLEEDPDPQDELISALSNISTELQKDVGQVLSARQFLLRVTGRLGNGGSGRVALTDNPNNSYAKDMMRRLSSAIAVDIAHSEKNVLYLEAMLDRARLEALRELGKQLKEDRQELTALLDQFKKDPDSVTQQKLLEQMQALKERMMELQQRMAELTKGIRDDFMNQEALKQMQEEMGLKDSLEDVEKAIREGDVDEALKQMQQLSMEMDEMLDGLDKAEDRAEEQMDPELARQFDEFQDTLKETIEKEDSLAQKTRQIRDKYRQQQKDRIAKQGEALKKELGEKLEELDKSWKELKSERFGFNFDDLKQQAQTERSNVQQSLEQNDFSLASESADQMEDTAKQMARKANDMRRIEEFAQNPAETRRESKQLAEKIERDAKRAGEVAQKLRDLFPQGGQQMSDEDRQQMTELGKQQKQLEQNADQLQQQMESINDRAPVFNETAQQQMQQAGERMQGAGEKLGQRDPGRAQGEQQGALQALRGVQQGLEQAGNGQGKKGGVPLPMRSQGGKRNGKGQSKEKVAIPDEDPNAGPREFRKDVMDAMKQGAPDRYRDQNKKYYEELVK